MGMNLRTLFSEVALQLGIKDNCSSSCSLQGNGRIEALHKCPKNYIRKCTQKGEIELDKVINITCDTYSFFPNSQSHKSSFFVMFGRNVYVPTLANLLTYINILK